MSVKIDPINRNIPAAWKNDSEIERFVTHLIKQVHDLRKYAMSSTLFLQDVAEGSIEGYSPFSRFGYNDAVPSGSASVISGTNGAAPYLPNTAVTVAAKSTSPNDTAAGSGAQSIVVTGVDGSFLEVTAEITMNGTSESTATVQTFLRVDDAYIKETGTQFGSNAGDITILASGGGTTFLTIKTGVGVAHSSVYTTRANQELYIYDVHFSVAAAKEVAFIGWAIQNADDVVTPFPGKRGTKRWPGIVGAMDFSYKNSPIRIPQKTDIWAAGQSSAGTASATLEYIGILKTV